MKEREWLPSEVAAIIEDLKKARARIKELEEMLKNLGVVLGYC